VKSRFSVPLLRFIIPIDCLQATKAANAKGRDPTNLLQQFSNIPLQTLVRLTRIETPLFDLVPNKPKASPTTPPLWRKKRHERDRARKQVTRRKPQVLAVAIGEIRNDSCRAASKQILGCRLLYLRGTVRSTSMTTCPLLCSASAYR
jgi:hypothetical protein